MFVGVVGVVVGDGVSVGGGGLVGLSDGETVHGGLGLVGFGLTGRVCVGVVVGDLVGCWTAVVLVVVAVAVGIGVVSSSLGSS